jgi:hypothetical protein
MINEMKQIIDFVESESKKSGMINKELLEKLYEDKRYFFHFDCRGKLDVYKLLPFSHVLENVYGYSI